MVMQVIGLGSVANDGTGDKPRDAGAKINANFAELYPILANNVARDVDQSLTNLRNLFDQSRTTDDNLVVPTTGATAAQVGYFATDYIPVQPGSSIVANKALFGSSGAGRAYYDANLTFVSGVAGPAAIAANTPIAVPATPSIRYVRLTVQTLLTKRSLVIVRGSVLPTIYRSFDADDRLSAHKAAIARVLLIYGDANLFDATKITASVLLNSTTGLTEASTATRYASDYIPVIEGGSLIFEKGNSLSANYGIAFYDLNKAYLSGIAGPIVANTVYTPPFGAAYARFGADTSTTGVTSAIAAYNAAVLPSFRKFGLPSLSDAAIMDEAYYHSFAPKYVNLFDIDEMASGTIVNSTNGNVGALAGNAATKLMRCTPGGSVIETASGVNSSAFGIAFYDINAKFISGIAAPIAPGVAQAVPATAYYWRTNVAAAYAANFYAGEGATLPPSGYVASWGAGYEKDKLQKGVQIAMSGDSIVAGNLVWPSAFPFIRGTYANNFGVNGTKMGDVLTGRVAADFTNIGLYGVSSGTNDWGLGNTAIGTATDAAGTATFIGQMKSVIETVLGWKPTLNMFFATPLHRATELTAGFAIPLVSYADAIVTTARQYGVPVIDQYRHSMVGPQTYATYLGDGLHPTATAGPLIGARWGRELARLFG